MKSTILGLLLLTPIILFKGVRGDGPVCNMKVPSDREVIQEISLQKDLDTCPPINIKIISSSGTIECPIDGNTSTITKAIEGSSSIVLVVLGFAVGPNKHVVQCLLDELVSQGNVVITVAVEYDNIINVLQGLLGIAKALRPIVQLLPAEKTTVVAAGAGAHLGSAVIGGLAKNIKFKKIIALDPVLPLLETDLFLQLLVGRSDEILVIHSSVGSYVSSIKFPPLKLSGASVIYVSPGDLTPFCGVGPSQFICRKAFSFKFLLDILTKKLLAAECSNLKFVDYFSPKKCHGSSPTSLSIDVKLKADTVYYAIIGTLAKQNAVTGLLNSVLDLVGDLLKNLLSGPEPPSHDIPAIVRDLIITNLTSPLAAGIVPLQLDANIDIVVSFEVGGKLVSGGLLDEVLKKVGTVLDDLLHDVGDVLDQVGNVVGGLLGALGLGSLGGPLDNLVQGVAVVVDYLGCQLDSLVSGLGDLLPEVLHPVQDLLGGVGGLLTGDNGESGDSKSDGLLGGLLGGGGGSGGGGLLGGLGRKRK